MLDWPSSPWNLVTLDSVCKNSGYILTGAALGKTGSGGTPVVMPKDITADRIDANTVAGLSGTDTQSVRNNRLRAGDLVCNRRGDIHRRALVSSAEDGWLCGTGCIQIRTGPALNTHYLYYLLAHPAIKAWIQREAKGTLMPHINIGTYRSLRFPLPSLDEQSEIVSTLSLLDQKIQLNQEMNNELDACAFELIRKELTPAALKTLDRDYTVDAAGNSLRDICVRIENGRTPLRSVPEFWSPPSIPWLNSNEIRQPIILKTQKCIAPLGLKKSSMKIWPVDTVVVSLCGDVGGNVSILGLPSAGNQSCCSLLLKDNLHPYAYFYLRLMRHQLNRLKTGAGSMQNLNQTTVSKFPILLPAKERRTQLCDRLNTLLKRIRHNLLEIETLHELRDRTLPDMIAGKLTIKKAVQTTAVL